MMIGSVDELMELLRACRGAWDAPDRGGDPVDLHDHGLQTAALLRRSHPSDKELQVAGLVHDLGHLLRPGDFAGHAGLAAEALRPLLGDRVARLVRLHVPAQRHGEPGGRYEETGNRYEAPGAGPDAADAVTLRQADDAGKVVGLDAGVMEDWRPVLELVAAGAYYQLPGA
ncbi:HD domain-containing protein [Streptomyces sp. NBC_00536]|nr:HD domain-containing protein [Streptomyces sp. NBC_00536]WUC83982.1 HD domain-containing protein [Streptomyces sp. NBC_00536]